jgi:hypothetical protein
MQEKPVRFTEHAEQKFDDLAELGFYVTSEQVVDVVLHPDDIDRNTYPPIAQKAVSQRHVLRVVYIEDSEGVLVVTFYPARRGRYEI